MKYAKIAVVIVFVSFLGLCFSNVSAFEASSANFEMHAIAIESISGSGTSTNFQNQSGGGQTATGIVSNAKKVFSGILYWLFDIFKPRYDQLHYRWRNDDGSESSATFAANEDTQLINIPKNTVKRLRFEVSNEGWTRGSAPQFRIEYAETTTCSTGSYTAVPTTSSLHWRMATSTYLTDGEATTNVADGLTDENAVFTAGQVKTTGNTTAGIALTSENFTEVEYGIAATNNATDGGTYCFRLTNNGSVSNFVYTQYAKAVLESAGPPGTPGTPTYSNVSTNTLTVSWTAATGADYYKLERTTSTVPGGFSQIASTTLLTYDDSGLAPNTTYWYKVRGTNEIGDGPYSATSSVTTQETGPTTTLGNGTNPSNATIPPGAAATNVDAFTFETSTSSDSITSVTVTLADGTYSGISLLEVTSDNGSTIYGSVSNPSTNTPTITLSPSIAVTTTLTQYKIRLTPKTHASMPPPPGSSYALTAWITDWTGINDKAGSDAGSATVTIDNQSPTSAGNVSGGAGVGVIDAIFSRITGSIPSVLTVTISLEGETRTITITPIGNIY